MHNIFIYILYGKYLHKTLQQDGIISIWMYLCILMFVCLKYMDL